MMNFITCHENTSSLKYDFGHYILQPKVLCMAICNKQQQQSNQAHLKCHIGRKGHV